MDPNQFGCGVATDAASDVMTAGSERRVASPGPAGDCAMDEAPLCSPDDERGCCAFEDEDEEVDQEADEEPSRKRAKEQIPEGWMHDAAATPRPVHNSLPHLANTQCTQ
jgi:hypothetical protein